MKKYLIILLFLFSCSHHSQNNVKENTQLRGPSSLNNCTDLIAPYLNLNSHESSRNISAKYLLNQKRISIEDYSILKAKSVLDFLDGKQNREELEANLALIKHQYKHFDEERVIRHYQFLEESCGI